MSKKKFNKKRQEILCFQIFHHKLTEDIPTEQFIIIIGNLSGIHGDKNVGHHTTTTIHHTTACCFVFQGIREMYAVGMGQLAPVISVNQLAAVVFDIFIRFLNTAAGRNVITRCGQADLRGIRKR